MGERSRAHERLRGPLRAPRRAPLRTSHRAYPTSRAMPFRRAFTARSKARSRLYFSSSKERRPRSPRSSGQLARKQRCQSPHLVAFQRHTHLARHVPRVETPDPDRRVRLQQLKVAPALGSSQGTATAGILPVREEADGQLATPREAHHKPVEAAAVQPLDVPRVPPPGARRPRPLSHAPTVESP